MIKELIAKIGLDNSGFVNSVEETKGVVNRLKKTFAEATKTLKEKAKELTDVKAKYGQLKEQLMANIQTFGVLKGSLVTAKMGIIALRGAVVALASATGIGLIVVALGALISYLTTTQEGMDKLRRVTEPVRQIFERLLGVLQTLGKGVFEGIAKIIKGDLVEGFKTLGSAAKEAGTNTKAAFTDGLDAGRRMADLTVEIEKAQNELIETQSRLNHEISEQRRLATDLSLSEAKRGQAAQKAIDLINERVKAEDNVLKLQQERLELSQKANDTDRKGEAELLTLKAQRRDLETEANNEVRRLQNLSNKELRVTIDSTKELIGLQREQFANLLKATKGMGAGRDPFSMQQQSKYSKELTENVAKLSNDLIGIRTQGLGIIVTDQQREQLEAHRQKMAELTREMALGDAIGAQLGQTLSNSFQAMLINGELSFKGLIRGLKAMIAQLIAAAAVAFTLNALLGGVGLGKGAVGGGFGSIEKFKDMFSSMTGLPRMARGGMVTGLTAAVIGDNPSGKEAVIPFERMGEFLGKYGGGGSQTIEVVGNFRNDAIYFSSASYSQRRNRILGI
jgi:esterase/lipase